MSGTNSKPNNKQKIIDTLAALKILHKIVNAPKARVATMAQISTSTFNPMISRMTKEDDPWIQYGSTPGTLMITDEGMRHANTEAVPTSNEERLESIKQKLRGKPRRIFEYLADGKVHDKEDVMNAVDCTNPKTFGPMVSRELRKPGYIDFPSKRTMQLSDECFLFGRPSDE
jgi:hypothetical protein